MVQPVRVASSAPVGYICVEKHTVRQAWSFTDWSLGLETLLDDDDDEEDDDDDDCDVMLH